jgi:hypothetical protein
LIPATQLPNESCPLNIVLSSMLVLLLAFSLFQTYYGDPGQGPASIELRAVSACGDQDSRRSIWSIVWSCLSTIFLCTWVAVHPNVAFRPDKPNAGWSERWDPLLHFWSHQLPLFMCALLVPEYILAWSIRQFIVAGKIREKGEVVSLAHQMCVAEYSPSTWVDEITWILHADGRFSPLSTAS